MIARLFVTTFMLVSLATLPWPMSGIVDLVVLLVVETAIFVYRAALSWPMGQVIAPRRDPALPRPAPDPFRPASGPFAGAPGGLDRDDANRSLMFLLCADPDEALAALRIANRAGRLGFNGVEAALAVLRAREAGFPLGLNCLVGLADDRFRYYITGILAHIDRDTGALVGFEPHCRDVSPETRR
jgi:hypothetical protein